MKDLKDILTEGLLADIETTMSSGTYDAAKIVIDEFINDNYVNTKYTISKKPNKDGKYVVNSRGEVKLRRLAETLVNDIFVWGKCKKFNCYYNEKIKNLIGAPEEVDELVCTGCYNLESLEGCPSKLKSFLCNSTPVKSLKGIPASCTGSLNFTTCWALESLEGCPKHVEGLHIANCENLISLEGAPEYVEGTFDCSTCYKLKSLKGAPKKVGGNFRCVYCHGLKSFEGAPESIGISFVASKCNNVESLDVSYINVDRNFDCSSCDKLKSFEGAPKTIGDAFIGSNCQLVQNLKGLPEKLGALYVDGTGLTSLEGCPKIIGKNSILGVFDLHCVNGNFTKKDVLDICKVNPNNVII